MSLLHGDALQEFQAETSMLKKLRHPNIVLFIGTVGRSSVAASPFDASGDLCLVTEYLARGSLQDVLGSTSSDLYSQAGEKRPHLQCCMALKMALDAATGIAYLHDMKILHRDLKSANCLVAADGTVKIADLGLAKCVISPHSYVFGAHIYFLSTRFVNQTENHQTFCGTLTHCVRYFSSVFPPPAFPLSSTPR
jgi:serine/threonine protein kinase